MDPTRFLIIGASGQLGKALQAKYPQAVAVERKQLDITDFPALEAFDWSKVDVILNAAVYANVDGAETPEGREAAWKINAQAVGFLSKIAAARDLTLVHVSSDYVFDGTKALHAESEPFTPLGIYGQTKAAGDIAASTAANYYILRTSWLIGNGPNFVRTMMALAAKNISPTVVADQTGRLTFTTTLVEAIDHLLRKNVPCGTYNASNDGEPVSWADITRTIFQVLGRDELPVTNTTTEQYFASKPGVAPRPLQSTLDLSKIKATGFRPRDWHDDLQHYIANEKDKERT
jgi:dTDP-4-dehydrorhamnose reductase